MKPCNLIAGGLCAVVLGIVLYSHERAVKTETMSPKIDQERPQLRPRLPAPPFKSAASSTQERDASRPGAELIQRLLKGENVPKLSLAEGEAFVARNRRTADSLLAAHLVTGESSFLDEALKSYPNDPRVAFAAAFKPGLSGAERSAILEKFKNAAPDNALANYLAASEHLKAGRTDNAIQELEQAYSKPHLQEYISEGMQASLEAYRANGYSEFESITTAATMYPLPQLAELRKLGRSIGEIAAAYRAGGDEASARAILEIGMDMGQKVATGQGPFIEDLVGVAVQSEILKTMDPASASGVAGKTVQDRLTELAQWKDSIKSLAKQQDEIFKNLDSEREIVDYFSRIMMFGETRAIQWLVNKHGPQGSSNPGR